MTVLYDDVVDVIVYFSHQTWHQNNDKSWNTGCRKKTIQSDERSENFGKWSTRLDFLNIQWQHDFQLSLQIWLRLMHWIKNYHPGMKKSGKWKWTTISVSDVNSVEIWNMADVSKLLSKLSTVDFDMWDRAPSCWKMKSPPGAILFISGIIWDKRLWQ